MFDQYVVDKVRQGRVGRVMPAVGDGDGGGQRQSQTGLVFTIR